MDCLQTYSTLSESFDCESVGQTETDRQGVLYYGFTDSTGYSTALHAWKLNAADNSAFKIFDSSDGSSITHLNRTHDPPIGLISAVLLHQVCGPYPRNIPDPTDLFHHIFLVYILPIIAVFVLITNILVCHVFLKQHLQNPVYTILLVIAIFEATNTLIPLPMYIAQSITHRKVWWEDLPKAVAKLTLPGQFMNRSWSLPPKSIYQTSSNAIASLISAWTTVFLPTVAHTVSVLLTVLLALQRLIYVTCPLKAPRWCSLTYSRCACVLVVAIAILLHSNLYSAKFVKFEPVVIRPINNDSLNSAENHLKHIIPSLPHIVMKCHLEDPFWMVFYFWSRIIIIHLLPCGILIVLTTLLVLAMREVAKRRLRLGLKSHSKRKPETYSMHYRSSPQKYIINNNHSPSLRVDDHHCNLHVPTSRTNILGHQTAESNSPSMRSHQNQSDPLSVSKMLITVLIKFLIVHIPNVIVILCYTIYKMRSQAAGQRANWIGHVKEPMLYDKPIWSKLEILCNILILLSYQMNFIIYWKISTGFRNTLVKEFSQCFLKRLIKDARMGNRKLAGVNIKPTNGGFVSQTHHAVLAGPSYIYVKPNLIVPNVTSYPSVVSRVCAKPRARIRRSFCGRHCHLPILFCCEHECSHKTISLTMIEGVKVREPVGSPRRRHGSGCSVSLNGERASELDQSCSLVEGEDKEGFQQPSSDI